MWPVEEAGEAAKHVSTAHSRNRVAVVTEACSPTGEAIARALARDGYRLALVGSGSRIDTLVAECANGSACVGGRATDYRSMATAAEVVLTAMGGASVLINNAAVVPIGLAREDNHGDYWESLEQSLLGAMTATDAFLDQLLEAGGDIVNISCSSVRAATADNGKMRTESSMSLVSAAMREELQPEIRVVLIEPGVDGLEVGMQPSAPLIGHQRTADRGFGPDDVAELASFALDHPRPHRVAEWPSA